MNTELWSLSASPVHFGDTTKNLKEMANTPSDSKGYDPISEEDKDISTEKNNSSVPSSLDNQLQVGDKVRAISPKLKTHDWVGIIENIIGDKASLRWLGQPANKDRVLVRLATLEKIPYESKG